MAGYRIFQVSRAKSSMDSCSARLSKTGSSVCSKRGFTALRNVFLRWLKAVFTRRKKLFSSLKEGRSALGKRRITALFTFGGG